MAEPTLVVDAHRSSRTSVRTALSQARLTGAPIVDRAGRFEGIVDAAALESSDQRADEREIGELVDAGVPTVAASSRLDVALESLTVAPQSWVTVLDNERRVVGTLSISDMVRAYRQELASSAERMTDLGVTTGAAQVTVTADSPVAGLTLRDAQLPAGLLITSISRGDMVLFPSGDSTLEVGDHLTVIGQGPELARIGEITSAVGTD